MNSQNLTVKIYWCYIFLTNANTKFACLCLPYLAMCFNQDLPAVCTSDQPKHQLLLWFKNVKVSFQSY